MRVDDREEVMRRMLLDEEYAIEEHLQIVRGVHDDLPDGVFILGGTNERTEISTWQTI